jgi:hypothetical protein
MKRLLLILLIVSVAFARDVEYTDGEMSVRVVPGEPTELKFPGIISGGFKKKDSSLSIDRKDSDLVIFAQQELSEVGEVLIVRLEDGRSYSIRVQRATSENPRDTIVKIEDARPAIVSSEEETPYKEKNFQYAPATQVSGLMREMILAAEFGKKAIPGYKMSERCAGEVVLDDGALEAKIERIFTGPNLWGYVINVENKLSESQKINPAAFRMDGTRAVSASAWELSGRPITNEQKLAGSHKAKVYVITKAR